jgi:hypothetical protein
MNQLPYERAPRQRRCRRPPLCFCSRRRRRRTWRRCSNIHLRSLKHIHWLCSHNLHHRRRTSLQCSTHRRSCFCRRPQRTTCMHEVARPPVWQEGHYPGGRYKASAAAAAVRSSSSSGSSSSGSSGSTSGGSRNNYHHEHHEHHESTTQEQQQQHHQYQGYYSGRSSQLL